MRGPVRRQLGGDTGRRGQGPRRLRDLERGSHRETEGELRGPDHRSPAVSESDSVTAETSRDATTAEPHQDEAWVQPKLASQVHRGLPTRTLGVCHMPAGWGPLPQGSRGARWPQVSHHFMPCWSWVCPDPVLSPTCGAQALPEQQPSLNTRDP